MREIELSRRNLIVLAGATLALAGCASPAPSPTGSPTPTPTVKPTVSPADWQNLAGTLSGSLAMPGDGDYDSLKVLENPRYDGVTPLAILEASSTDDVAAGLAFAAKIGLPLEVRSGGHS